jgi:cell division protein ZapA
MAETQPRAAAEIARPPLVARDMESVVVDIYDQIYQLRGVNPEHIERLAEVVDSKMRAVSAHGSTVDSLRVAVLAALNLADELVTLRGKYEATIKSAEAHRQAAAQSLVRARAGSLMGMLDEVLLERKAG